MRLRPPAACALLALAGCTDWPRHAHLPPGADPDAVPAGTDPGAAIPVDWRGPQAHADEATALGLPVADRPALSQGEGLLLYGRLVGAGWSDLPADTAGACGERAFPLDPEGSYAGDVDWIGLRAEQPGRLCATLEVDDPDALLDLLGFLLDPCAEPDAVLVDAAGQPLGYAASGPAVAWGAEVGAGREVGVALAAYWPDDLTADVDWRLGLSLIDGERCPDLPPWP